MIPLIFVCSALFFNYFLTLSNSIYGGDGGDLVSAMLAKGFAHPPGYPLYMIIGRLFLALPVNYLTPAGKVTLISILASLASIFLVGLIIKQLSKSKVNNYVLTITLFILGFNYLIWLYNIVPEVFPLNTLIILLVFFSSLKYYNTKKNFWLGLIFFIIGLATTHHHTFILILPSAFFLIYKKIKINKIKIKQYLAYLSLFILGLIPLAYLPIVTSRYPEIIWEEANTISGFINLFLRNAYGTFVPNQFISSNPIHRLIQLVNIIYFSISDFTIVGFILISVGLFVLFKKRKNPMIFSYSISLILFGPFFFFYANFPLRLHFEMATVERFLIIFYFLLAIPLYFGLKFFWEKLTIFLRKISLLENKKFLIDILLFITLSAMPIGIWVKSYRTIRDLKIMHIGDSLGIDVLSNIKKPAIILLQGDTILFDTQYAYFSNKKKYPDIIVAQTNQIAYGYYQKTLKLNHPRLNIQFDKKNYNMTSIIKDNLKSYHIYSNLKINDLGLTDYDWITRGLLFELVPKKDINNVDNKNSLKLFWSKSMNKSLFEKINLNDKVWNNYFLKDVLRVYSIAHQNTADYYLNTDDLKLAQEHINMALILNPEDLDNLYLQSIYYVKTNKCSEAEKSITKALNKSKDSLYTYQLSQLINCYKDEFNKARIEKKIKNYSNKSLKKLLN